jgi:hypothetical protein
MEGGWNRPSIVLNVAPPGGRIPDDIAIEQRALGPSASKDFPSVHKNADNSWSTQAATSYPNPVLCPIRIKKPSTLRMPRGGTSSAGLLQRVRGSYRPFRSSRCAVTMTTFSSTIHTSTVAFPRRPCVASGSWRSASATAPSRKNWRRAVHSSQVSVSPSQLHKSCGSNHAKHQAKAHPRRVFDAVNVCSNYARIFIGFEEFYQL